MGDAGIGGGGKVGEIHSPLGQRMPLSLGRRKSSRDILSRTET